jgi:hypothetical protein
MDCIYLKYFQYIESNEHVTVNLALLVSFEPSLTDNIKSTILFKFSGDETYRASQELPLFRAETVCEPQGLGDPCWRELKLLVAPPMADS